MPTSPHQLTPCQSTEILLAAQATGFTAQEHQQVFISGNVPKTERETHRMRERERESHTSASTRIMYTLLMHSDTHAENSTQLVGLGLRRFTRAHTLTSLPVVNTQRYAHRNKSPSRYFCQMAEPWQLLNVSARLCICLYVIITRLTLLSSYHVPGAVYVPHQPQDKVLLLLLSLFDRWGN